MMPPHRTGGFFGLIVFVGLISIGSGEIQVPVDPDAIIQLILSIFILRMKVTIAFTFISERVLPVTVSTRAKFSIFSPSATMRDLYTSGVGDSSFPQYPFAFIGIMRKKSLLSEVSLTLSHDFIGFIYPFTERGAVGDFPNSIALIPFAFFHPRELMRIFGGLFGLIVFVGLISVAH
jgi:hypothetical protein